MNFSAWQSLAPAAAARELHRRAGALAPAQRRAVFAHLPGERELAGSFARPRRGGPLDGVPFLAKDLFDVAGWPTLAGSTFLPEARPTPPRSSALIRRLDECGAVLAGKTHLHEFAYGITGENAHYGDCEHPRFPGRTTGGSSSGSAAAVAAGIVPLALGTDTGGSVRVPAAFCGLYGFRLTPGDTWIADAFPLAPSFDTAGWFTAEAGDMAVAVEALVAPEPAGREPRGCWLELPGLDPEVAAVFRAASARLCEPADASGRDALLAAFAPALGVYNVIVADEAWAVHRGWAEKYRDRYSPPVWLRLTRGLALTAAEIDAARAGLVAMRTAWDEFFRGHDFLVLPASPGAALTKAECTLANRERILRLTAPASIGGRPVLTLPVALPSGLTTGLQVVLREPRSAVTPWALARWKE